MRVADLSHLADIWRLIEKDPGMKELYLDAHGSHVIGMHIEGHRVAKEKLPFDRPFSVEGNMLSGTLALMDAQADIDIRETDVSVILTAKRRRAVLRKREANPPLAKRLSKNLRSFDSTRLRDEISFLRACVGGGVIAPMLTGIHFRSAGKDMHPILEATDGSRRSGLVAVPLKSRVRDHTVPAADLELALSLLSDQLMMLFTTRHLILSDKVTTVKLSLLQGAYPDLSKLPAQQRYRHQLKITRSQIDTAVKAAVLFDSDRIVRLVINNKQASLLVEGQETGGFRQPVGRCRLSDIEITFDADWLDAAQYIGDVMTLRYNDGRSPVLFSGNRRKLWMSPIVKA
jgi:hypothetical protein